MPPTRPAADPTCKFDWVSIAFAYDGGLATVAFFCMGRVDVDWSVPAMVRSSKQPWREEKMEMAPERVATMIAGLPAATELLRLAGAGEPLLPGAEGSVATLVWIPHGTKAPSAASIKPDHPYLTAIMGLARESLEQAQRGRRHRAQQGP